MSCRSIKFTAAACAVLHLTRGLGVLQIHGKSRFPGLSVWLADGTRCPVSIPQGCLLCQVRHWSRVVCQQQVLGCVCGGGGERAVWLVDAAHRSVSIPQDCLLCQVSDMVHMSLCAVGKGAGVRLAVRTAAQCPSLRAACCAR